MLFFYARGQGFEPRLPEPEPGVLPLDDPRNIEKFKNFKCYLHPQIYPQEYLNLTMKS